jgi:tetratricopeptide (TPR) repeat protein
VITWACPTVEDNVQEHKATRDGCLDVETLAAFVDGGLTSGERSRVELHLAACQDCFALFTESVKTAHAMTDRTAPARGTVASIATRPRRGLVRWAAAGAGLAAAAALALAVWWPRAERPELVDLVAAVGERRPVEARLTGGFRFGPIESPTRGADRGADARVLAAAGKLEEKAGGTGSARLLGALGTAYLVTRDYDNAVKQFDRAIDLAPDDPLLRSDRAAALLSRGDTALDDGAADFARALDDATRALAMNKALPEAIFNKAIALQRMQLEDQELQTWRDYLALDASSAWASEARERIAALEASKKQVRPSTN